MHTSTSSNYLPKMSSLQYFKVTFFPQRKLEAASSQSKSSFSAAVPRDSIVLCGLVPFTTTAMTCTSFRVRDFLHSKFFLTLGNIRLFQVIDNRSFRGIDPAPIQVSRKVCCYWLEWYGLSPNTFIILFWDLIFSSFFYETKVLLTFSYWNSPHYGLYVGLAKVASSFLF